MNIAAFGLGTLPTHADTQANQANIPNIPQNPYGVNVFLHKEVEQWKIEKTLQMAAAANIQYIKQEFPWDEIEFKKGYFQDDKWNKSSWEKFDNIVDLADKYGLTIIARVDHAPDWAKAPEGINAPLKDNKDLADFTNALLDHYKGKIKYIQIWNEPNLAGEWLPGKAVDPTGYANMLKTVYPAVKAAHPDAVVLSAPMAMTTEGVASTGQHERDRLLERAVQGGSERQLRHSLGQWLWSRPAARCRARPQSAQLPPGGTNQGHYGEER